MEKETETDRHTHTQTHTHRQTNKYIDSERKIKRERVETLKERQTEGNRGDEQLHSSLTPEK